LAGFEGQELVQVYRYVAQGAVVYVGMGKPGRSEYHLKACLWGQKQPFYNKLRKLLRLDEPVDVEILWEGFSRDEAAKKECEFIELYGRRHVGGTLWNLASGGQGCALSGEALAKRNAAIRAALLASPAVHARRKPPKKKLGPHTPTVEERARISERMTLNNPMTRRDVVEKMRISKTGKAVSEETRTKMSAARAGKKCRIVTCPHCGKSGGAATMPRWHFANCKELNK
jgi:hypothetical protein